jgi:hypothetical protein
MASLALLLSADSVFMRALRCFKRRVLYACIEGDYSVPYCTASISLRNPYRTGEKYGQLH